MFNSEVGGSVSAPDLGLAFHSLLERWPDSVAVLCAEVKAVVERFEPRLSGVEVTLKESKDLRRLSVWITASVDATRVQISSELPGAGGAYFRAASVKPG